MKKNIRYMVIILILAGLGIGGYWYWYNSTYYPSTDDAYVLRSEQLWYLTNAAY